MSRVINPNQPGKLRKEILRVLVAAVKAYRANRAEQPAGGSFDAEARDLVAFTILSLVRVNETVLRTVEPWEKRDYWLKADRFRLEWGWAGQFAVELTAAFQSEALGAVDTMMARVWEKVGSIPTLQKYAKTKPWRGAWQVWSGQQAGRA